MSEWSLDATDEVIGYARPDNDAPEKSIREEQAAQVTDLVTVAKTYQIASLSDVEVGAEMIRGMKDLQKEIEDHHGPIKKAAHAAWKAACDAENRLLKPIKASITAVRKQMTDFETARQREALEARKQAEQEAKKLAAEMQIEEDLVPVIEPDVPKADGVTYTTKYEWQMTGTYADINPGFLTLDMASINALVRSKGKDAERIVGGITVTEKKIPRIK